MSDFSFGDVEDALGTLYNISPSKRVAFGGRIKSLHKYGVPHRLDTPGRGRAARYNFIQVMQYAVGVALLFNSVQPEQAGALVTKAWHMIRDGIPIGVRAASVWQEAWMAGETPPRDRRRRWLFFTAANAFSDLQSPSPVRDRFLAYGALFDPKDDERLTEMTEVLKESAGWTMIDVTRIAADVAKHLIVAGKADGTELLREVMDEIMEDSEARAAFAAMLRDASDIPPDPESRTQYAAKWTQAAEQCFPSPIALTMSAAYHPEWVDHAVSELGADERSFLLRASADDILAAPTELFAELVKANMIQPDPQTVWRLSRWGEAVQKALRLGKGSEYVGS